MSRTKHRVVVVGGGYVGALAATRAADRAGKRATVTLVDPGHKQGLAACVAEEAAAQPTSRSAK